MVQTDASQLTTECTEWRQILRRYRGEFQDCEKALFEMCKGPVPKQDRQQVEHFQNQFDIQLHNIHDLKQTIKQHERTVKANTGGEEVYTQQKRLLNEFLSLENTLQDLRDKFRDFVNKNNC